MPYVNVPNDLSKIKTKMAFNLTKRQLICFGCAAAVGIPSYLLARSAIGNTGAMFLMPVSYTHLDVYKRQKKRKAAERKRKQRQKCHALEPFKPA